MDVPASTETDEARRSRVHSDPPVGAPTAALVPEVPAAGEHHGQPVLGGIANRANADRLAANEDLAEEGCEKVFLLAERRLAELTDGNTFAQWLLAIAREVSELRETAAADRCTRGPPRPRRSAFSRCSAVRSSNGPVIIRPASTFAAARPATPSNIGITRDMARA